jgi:hypothetical protein
MAQRNCCSFCYEETPTIGSLLEKYLVTILRPQETKFVGMWGQR